MKRNIHEKLRRNEMIETRETGEQMHMTPQQTGTWVHEVLEPDQLSTAKQSFGRRTLSRRTVILLWALRIYVLLMVFLIAFQAWNALHAGG
jgi:hypothetical protein